MKYVKKQLNLILIVCCALLLSACASQSETAAAIRARGELRVGVKVDVKNFGYLNPETNALEGLEIDLSRELAEMLLGDRSAIRFIPVTAPAREAAITNGEVDLVIATYTITEARQEVLNFSRSYYIDEVGFLVLKSSGINKTADFTGKTIGTTRSSTAFTTLTTQPELWGGSFTHKGFASYPELQSALQSGEIDVFCADKSILFGYYDDTTVLLEEGVSAQPYGIASNLEDKDFAAEIDKLLSQLEENGRLAEILAKWAK